MYVIVFYYKHHIGLLELVFDDREKAETVLQEFEDSVYEPRLPATAKQTLRIESKYGVAVLNLDDYSAAVLSNLEETEELQITLGVRRAKIERKAQEEFNKWASTHQNLQSGGKIGIKVPGRDGMI